ncbi:MAG TPA: hypothetical protein DCY55_13320 [Gammaproteobacteria bacterium]|nr:hypothetical protein [Gammaproteobacteria bacterium]
MRIWDVSPAYLNRQSLLGEHRELHGLVSILVNKKKGYARHPETLRWAGYGWAIRIRHLMLSKEMHLRGYIDNTPVLMRSNKGEWPTEYIDTPSKQLDILKEKYLENESGRLSLPKNAQQMWSQHKYSILARDQNLYKKIGREVAVVKRNEDFSELADLLSKSLRIPPSTGGIRNALQHMWGYISANSPPDSLANNISSLSNLLAATQHYSIETGEPYLMNSTALGELGVWL